jgi:hypothetical protein
MISGKILNIFGFQIPFEANQIIGKMQISSKILSSCNTGLYCKEHFKWDHNVPQGIGEHCDYILNVFIMYSHW